MVGPRPHAVQTRERNGGRHAVPPNVVIENILDETASAPLCFKVGTPRVESGFGWPGVAGVGVGRGRRCVVENVPVCRKRACAYIRIYYHNNGSYKNENTMATKILGRGRETIKS